MNLKELKKYVDLYYNEVVSVHKGNPESTPVLITLDDSSIGARASSDIKYICMGFDWEHNQLRIEPEKRLVTQGRTCDDPMEVVRREFQGKNYWCCPVCDYRVARADSYCRTCGQKLRK